jgi:predicted TPR repeat methyltransferase
MSDLSHYSGDLMADRRYTFGRDLAARGDHAAAADLFAQSVEIAPHFVAGWFALGEALEKLERAAEATSAYRRALAGDPQDHHGATLRMIRLGAEPAGEMPPSYVRAVFDQYAARFDRALVEGLAYKGPAQLRRAVERACSATGAAPHFSAVLDLGCGTGLGGAAFRDIADHLAGVDLSPNMVAEARKRQIFDRLDVGDIVPYLAEHPPQQFDLVLAADVFAYFASLGTVLKAATRVLREKGFIAFTVETYEGEDVALGEKLRYAHGSAHVRLAAAEAGLTIISLDAVSTRNEAGSPVPGLLAVAQRVHTDQPV